MEILDKGALEKSLNIEKRTPDFKKPRKKIYEVLEDDYFDESKENSQNSSLQNAKWNIVFLNSLHMKSRGRFNKLVSNMDYFQKLQRLKYE